MECVQQTLEQYGLPGSREPTHWIKTAVLISFRPGSSAINLRSNSRCVTTLGSSPYRYSSGSDSLAPVAMIAIPCSTRSSLSLEMSVVLKFPTKPSTLPTSVSRCTSMLLSFWTVSIKSDRFVWTSSPFHVLKRFRAWPPRSEERSTRQTGNPWAERLFAATMPEIPPPMTRAFWLMSSSVSTRGSMRAALATAIRTRSLAFSVAN